MTRSHRVFAPLLASAFLALAGCNAQVHAAAEPAAPVAAAGAGAASAGTVSDAGQARKRRVEAVKL